MKKTYNRLIKGIKQYFNKNNFKKAVIGVSGGLDSALSLFLVARAIGNNNVMALIMPEKGCTLKKDVDDAIQFCKKLGVSYKIIEINRFLDEFKRLPWQRNKISEINLKARVRAVILYNYANANNALVIGTSNKSELMLGYFTKYGDGACDIGVIGSLYKTDVIKLARYLKLPDKIINKIPSAGLYKGQCDEKELGSCYADIDKILKTKNFNSRLGKRLLKRIKKNRHKLEKAFVIR